MKVNDEMNTALKRLSTKTIVKLTSNKWRPEKRLPKKPRANSRTVGKILNCMLYIIKLDRKCSAERNRSDVREGGRAYAAGLPDY